MFEIINKVKNKASLTEEEANLFLEYVCDFIRKDSKILDPMDSDCKVCDETSSKFISAMFKFGYNSGFINIKEELDIPLTHLANTIFLNVSEKQKLYLVDMTYSQFFGDSITLDNDEVVTTEVFNDICEEKWVQNLRQKGFVELTDDIEEVYLNKFVNLCKNKSLD